MACIVVNPSKRRATATMRGQLSAALREAGYTPHWLETTAAEPGAGQARLAVASGARLVVAAGGDGTVRSVAAGLADTGVEMGVAPLGTANLAARNLGIPLADPARIVRIAASGQARPCDLAWVSTQADDAQEGFAGLAPPGGWARPTLGGEHACMVVAGVGFDAGLVASTRPGLKARIGWGAYAVAAMENLRHPRMDLVLSLDERPAPARGGRSEDPRLRVERLTARSLLVANGGRLPAGITLLPGARVDDGLLDIAAIDTVAGIVGWSSLARQVLPPYAAAYADPERATGRVVQRRGSGITVRLGAPALVEVDGDLLPPSRGVRVRLQAGAVRVRRP